jgi:hypothetical protein
LLLKKRLSEAQLQLQQVEQTPQHSSQQMLVDMSAFFEAKIKDINHAHEHETMTLLQQVCLPSSTLI